MSYGGNFGRPVKKPFGVTPANFSDSLEYARR